MADVGVGTHASSPKPAMAVDVVFSRHLRFLPRSPRSLWDLANYPSRARRAFPHAYFTYSIVLWPAASPWQPRSCRTFFRLLFFLLTLPKSANKSPTAFPACLKYGTGLQASVYSSRSSACATRTSPPPAVIRRQPALSVGLGRSRDPHCVSLPRTFSLSPS